MAKQPLYANRYLKRFDNDMLRIINAIQIQDGVLLSYSQRHYVWFIVFHLKRIGAWDKIKALYGFVGGTSATHRWNWKDLRDLDSAYRLTFPNSMNHGSYGIQGNKFDMYADTHINVLSTFPSKNISFGMYTNNTEWNNSSEYDLGAVNDNLQLYTLMGANDVGVTPFLNGLSPYDGRFSQLTYMGVKRGGFYGFTSSEEVFELYGNDRVLDAVASFNQTDLPNLNIWLCGANRGSGVLNPTNKKYQSFYISDDLSSRQSVLMSYIFKSAQAILGRE